MARNVVLTVLGLVNAQLTMHIMLQHYDVLRFDATAVINVLINISSPKLNNQFFFISKHRMHEYASGLTSTPKQWRSSIACRPWILAIVPPPIQRCAA